ncbi:hypothetical protein Nepgr_012913 [Nepenthes gracilis]|uniref:Uncharacterized protein n=1 Tax=Nepenthes gracilis TaxID=150966 RepID=A0AAD3SI40_NEPGR|nr:hypothetical protein Nepgr_012913 [Nepenthes gracilis]
MYTALHFLYCKKVVSMIRTHSLLVIMKQLYHCTRFKEYLLGKGEKKHSFLSYLSRHQTIVSTTRPSSVIIESQKPAAMFSKNRGGGDLEENDQRQLKFIAAST